MAKDKSHFDVLIIGAGISGIGMAYHLQDKCPNKSFAILEGRSSLGGTWDLFRYPGIRSDSDMHTLGYEFRPWHGQTALADGPAIRSYLEETAREYGILPKIRFHHKITSARWSSANARWTIEAQITPSSKNGTNGSAHNGANGSAHNGTNGSAQTKIFTCNFLQICTGYYSYQGGYQPDFNKQADFKGEIIHPQKWPENFDERGKKIVVIGSGATAVTLVPALAQKADHVTMLQRSPTYVVSLPNKDVISKALHAIMPTKWADNIVRFKNIKLQARIYNLSRNKPERVKNAILKMARKKLPKDFDIDTHFSPKYNPWDQRMCLIPDGDLFEAISHKKASVITDHIECFTPSGIRLQSGKKLDADVIVTATGLNMVILGEIDFEIDGKAVDFSKSWIYKGMMYSDIPNLAANFGYINASWTLRTDLQHNFICKLLNHLDEIGNLDESGKKFAVPRLRESDKNMQAKDFIVNFSSGYMRRVMEIFPKQGDHEPWVNKQDYQEEKKSLLNDKIDDGVLSFKSAKGGENQPAPKSAHVKGKEAQKEAVIA